MKKTSYIIGSVEIIVGIVLLCVTSIIKGVMPILGRVAYQAAAAGGYSASKATVCLHSFISICADAMRPNG